MENPKQLESFAPDAGCGKPSLLHPFFAVGIEQSARAGSLLRRERRGCFAGHDGGASVRAQSRRALNWRRRVWIISGSALRRNPRGGEGGPDRRIDNAERVRLIARQNCFKLCFRIVLNWTYSKLLSTYSN
jgi:hypothetical protein